MRNSYFRAGCLFAIMLLSLAACSAGDEAMLASGPRLNWSELKGQWVVVNYWAEWCKPCHEEIPELNALDREPSVRVLGVNYDGLAGAELEAILKRMDVRFSALLEDPRERFGWTQPVGLPATYVINPQGQLVESLFGPQTRKSLLAIIESGSE